jgi:hypothetical protein
MRNVIFALAAILALGSLSVTSDGFARDDHGGGGHSKGHGGGHGHHIGVGHGPGSGPSPYLGGTRQFYHARW